jgi:pyridoxine 5-phosphate synthase
VRTKLGVNIDHVATVRQARRTFEPDPVTAAALATLGGADCITVHLREDRRHIQDRDLRLLRQTVFSKLNLEMAASEEVIAIALRTRPEQVTLVPEKRQEVTTEGGLDVVSQLKTLAKVASDFRKAGILVSYFIDPDAAQIHASKDAGADLVELHTGEYANAQTETKQSKQLERLIAAADEARRIGLRVNAGHGLTYHNVGPLAQKVHAEELHIGHSIIARAIFVGIERAVREMKEIIEKWTLRASA